jgi:chemotaxis protein CheZ
MNNTKNSIIEPLVSDDTTKITQTQPDPPTPTLVSTAVKNKKEESEAEDNVVFDQIGHLTRTLHDSLRELGYDTRLKAITSEVPETQDRLSYVATKSEQAAERVLTATEIAMPIQDKLSADAVHLSEQWQQAFETEQSLPPDADKFKDLLIQTLTYLNEVPNQTKNTNAQLMEIMMAQDFQDLTGQVMKKVTKMVQDLEAELLQLLVEHVPQEKKEAIETGLIWLNETMLRPTKAVNERLATVASSPLKQMVSLAELLRRPEMDFDKLTQVFNDELQVTENYRQDIKLQIKYEGYIKRQQEQVERFRKFESINLPDDLDFAGMSGLSAEVVEKLSKIRPLNLGQASRISGVTPAAVSILQVQLKKSGLL